MNKNILKNQEISGLQATKFFKTETTETVLISLQKGTMFPTHTSPKETLLVVLEGIIDFYIDDKIINLSTQEVYCFPEDVAHHVIAQEDAKFLIIR